MGKEHHIMEHQQRHKFVELCLPYALGRLNQGQRKQFEAHLRTECAQCTHELAEINESLSLLPLMLKQKSAPRKLRSKILDLTRSGAAGEKPVRGKTPVAIPVERPWFGYGLGFVVLVILVAFGWYVNSLHETLSTQDVEIAELRSELQQNEEMLAILGASEIEVVQLKGTEIHPAAHGKIIWDTEKKAAIVHVANLPPTPDDKEYQLWIVKDKPISSGLFAVGKEQESLFKLVNLDASDKKEIQAFMVTLELKGSQQPSGAVYLRGNIR